MSDTQMLPETAAVAGYVERVRAALGDLPADEVDDLTQGMEADLSEALTEGAGDLNSRFGTPEAYAAELRSAAGLPPAVVAGPPRVTVWSRVSDAGTGWRERHPRLTALARELAPVWWLGRGLGAAYLVSAVLGMTRIPAAVLLVAASLYVGLRGREDKVQPGLLRTLDRLWNLSGLLLVPIAAWLVLGLSVAAYGGSSYEGGQPYIQQGLVLDGSSIDGIYAYGADGKRLDNVRLFASDGQPITVESQVGPTTWVDLAGRQWANVFPGNTGYGQGWTVGDEGYWHPPMSIDPLVRRVPDPVDPSVVSPGAEGAPTEATPTSTVTPTATGAPTAASTTTGRTTSTPSGAPSSPSPKTTG